MAKYLDLAGLTAYDTKIKQWFKSGIAYITDDSIRVLFVKGQPNNEIWYTSSDGNIVTPDTDVLGAKITSNTYENGKGVITCDGDVTSFGDWAFFNCSSLTSVTIPNSVTSIGYSAFADCWTLTSITIPNSVTSIGSWAFENCDALTSITYEGTQEQWNTVTKGSDWNYMVPATHVQCTDGQVTL